MNARCTVSARCEWIFSYFLRGLCLGFYGRLGLHELWLDIATTKAVRTPGWSFLKSSAYPF
jgi:hypothetical protein